jgi:sigma-B regulation protein RsbU (phosphoserine phosphatase)
VDAENGSGEMFGNDRLTEVLDSLTDADADTVVKAVLDHVATFQDGREHFDDETLLVLQVR